MADKKPSAHEQHAAHQQHTATVKGSGRGGASADIEAYVTANYGYLAAFLKIPEVHDLLLKAAAGKWDQAKLQGELYKTKWWQSTNSTMRAWDTLVATDKATADKQVADTKQALRAEAQRMGVTLSDADVKTIAAGVLRFGWNEQQTQQAITSHFTYSSEKDTATGGPSGSTEVTVDSLRAHASQYLVPVSDVTLTSWTRSILNGTADLDAFDSYLRDQAKSLFPTMGTAIDQGITPLHYVSPYQEIAASLLELNPDDVNFTDAKWQRAINNVDPKTGLRAPMSLADWQRTLMTDPAYGYDRTQGAREKSTDFAARINQMFGARG